MEDLSLHVLDVAENALASGADRIEVLVSEEAEEGLLTLEIHDNGAGMDDETAQRVLDPFYTTKPGKRVGLGLPLLAQAAREAGGQIEIDSKIGRGTLVRASFRLGHPDLKPVGDMLATMATLACANPTGAFVFKHLRNGDVLKQWNSNGARPRET